VAPLGRAGLGSLPETVVITRERQLIEPYFLGIKISKFNQLLESARKYNSLITKHCEKMSFAKVTFSHS
jgi:hypothetical protein